MSQERFHDAMICLVHKEVCESLDFSILIKEFISRTEIRRNLFGSWHDRVHTLIIPFIIIIKLNKTNNFIRRFLLFFTIILNHLNKKLRKFAYLGGDPPKPPQSTHAHPNLPPTFKLRSTPLYIYIYYYYYYYFFFNDGIISANNWPKQTIM